MPWTVFADLLSSSSGIYSNTYHLRKPEVWCICYTFFSHVVDTAGVLILRGREWSRKMTNEESKDTQLVRIRIKTENFLSPGSGSFCYTVHQWNLHSWSTIAQRVDYHWIPWMFKTKGLFSPNQFHPLCSSLPSSSLFQSTRKLHHSLISPLDQTNEADALLPLFPPSNPFCTTEPA